MAKKEPIFSRFPYPLPFLLDGATGTNMIEAGMPQGMMPEQWILDHPDVFIDLQKQYSAYSNVVYTPTFGANGFAMARYGKTDVEAFNTSLASLTRKAVGQNVLVIGDLAPTGEMLAPFGEASFEEIEAAYARQASALVPFADAFVTETNLSLAETRAAVSGIRKASSKPIFATVSVAENGKTMSGDTPLACLLSLAACGVCAFGLNCSCGPESMLAFLLPLVPYARALGIPLIAKPNAGTPRNDECGHTCFPMTPEDFAISGKRFLSAGIPILGGCCGTTPAHIKALFEAIRTDDSFAGDEIRQADLPDLSRVACSRNTVLTLPSLIACPPLTVDEDISDNAKEQAEENGGFACISLQNTEEAALLFENSAFLPMPLALTGDRQAIEAFCRVYPGKPLLL